MSETIYQTPIGIVTVFLQERKVCHVMIKPLGETLPQLMLNQVVFKARIDNYKGQKGICRHGYTSITSHPFKDKVKELSEIFYTSKSKVFDASTGFLI